MRGANVLLRHAPRHPRATTRATPAAEAEIRRHSVVRAVAHLHFAFVSFHFTRTNPEARIDIPAGRAPKPGTQRRVQLVGKR